MRPRTRATLSRNRSRSGQFAEVTITFVAMQLNEQLLVIDVATFSAWKSSCFSEYAPGTMIQGVTLPNSLVMGLRRTGSFSRFRRSRSAPAGPQTIASCEWIEPVMCTSSTRSCATAAAPTSAPP